MCERSNIIPANQKELEINVIQEGMKRAQNSGRRHFRA